MKIEVRRQLPLYLGAVVLALGLLPLAKAMELEPRAYSNAPVGFNFLVLGYAYSHGAMSTEPTLPLSNAQLKVDTAFFAYVRSLDLWGKSGKFDLILPVSRLSGTATYAGTEIDRHASGLGDPRARLSVNLYGAPALSLQDFAHYEQDLVIGASVQVSAPGGQYDADRVVNLATNRWSIKPDIGFSKAFGDVTLDFTGSVTLYSDNNNYYGGKTLEVDPVYAVQSNLSYTFAKGAWASLGVTYYAGGESTVDGVAKDNAVNNSRVGLTLAQPLDRNNSIKFNLSRGVSTRVGTDFTTIGVAWQYRWLDGY